MYSLLFLYLIDILQFTIIFISVHGLIVIYARSANEVPASKSIIFYVTPCPNITLSIFDFTG